MWLKMSVDTSPSSSPVAFFNLHNIYYFISFLMKYYSSYFNILQFFKYNYIKNLFERNIFLKKRYGKNK